MKPIFEEERQFFNKKTNILLPTNCWRNGGKIYLDFTCKVPIIEFKVKDKTIIVTKNNINNNIKNNNKNIQKNIDNLIIANKSRLEYLEKLSINKTINYIIENPNHKFVISHSGGKDSTVTYNIWIKALEKLKTIKYEKIRQIYENLQWEINFSNTSNDTADTYKYIKTELPKDKLHILNPKIGFYQWIVNVKNYFIPSVMVRNCCSTYKEGQINKYYNKKDYITMVLGVRKYESTKRAEFDYIMDEEFRINLYGKSNFPKKWVKFAPIVEWKDEDVWLYILANELKYNNQYNYGFNRCGCLICPYQSDYTDLLIEEYYPKLWNRWIDILKNNYSIWSIKDHLKWTFEEWCNGKWKQGTSAEYEIIKLTPTPERIKHLSEIKGISEVMAKKYFNKKCICGKKLNPTELSMNYKEYGRYENIEDDNRQLLCKKCFCKKEEISDKEYTERAIKYREEGCNLF